MQRGLEVCANQLKEVEDKLIELRSSSNETSDQFIVAEALSFVEQAQKAISNAQSQVGRLAQKMVPS